MPASAEEEARGALIVFEGLDRAGKSTQHARALQSLRREGRKVEGMRFPGKSNSLFHASHALLYVAEPRGADHVY